MQILHVCDLIEEGSVLQHIRVISKQLLSDDASAMVDLLEVWISEANKDAFQTVLLKVIVQLFHSVRAHYGHVHAVVVLAVDAECVRFLCHKVGDFVANLLTKEELLGERFLQSKHETAVAATNVDACWLHFSELIILPWNRIVHLMQTRVNDYFVAIVVLAAEEARIVHLPLSE